MTEKKKSNAQLTTIIIISIFLLASITIFSLLLFSSKSEINSLESQKSNLENQVNSLQTEIDSQPEPLDITATELDSLREKEQVLTEIRNYQKEGVSQIAQAQVIAANLADYYDTWSNSVIGSSAEERALKRYKEELDKFEDLKDRNNKLISDNSDLLQEYLYINPNEQISANNLAYTIYEDEYFDMLNFEE